MCGEFIDVLGAGRTDAGVHARGMVANAVFDATDKERGGRERTPDEIRDYMNRYLPVSHNHTGRPLPAAL